MTNKEVHATELAEVLINAVIGSWAMETLLLVPHAGLSTTLRCGRDDTLSDKGMSINSDDAVIGI
jgi:hypothetical protein